MWCINSNGLRQLQLTCVLIFLWNFGNAQFTFNTRLPIVAGTVFNSVQILNDGTYLVTGSTIDSIPNVHADAISAIFDASGNLLSSLQFGDSIHQTITQFHTLSYVPGVYLQQGYGQRNGNACAILLWFNDLGDTIRTKEIYSPQLGSGNFGEEFINPLYSLLMPDSTVYLSSVIFQPTTNNDVCIWHLDKFGNELWHFLYATTADPEICHSIIPTTSGIVTAILKGGFGSSFLSQLVLQKIDTSGNDLGVLDEVLWDNGSYTIRTLINESNGIVCAGGVSESVDATSRCAIWKIDENGLLLWNSPIGDYPLESNNFFYFKNLVKTTDNNYVGTSDFFYVDNNGNSYHVDVRLIKASSEDGHLIWERYYHYVESDYDIHAAIDLKATPDGGVVFCGHASDNDSSNPNYELPAQQGWIVKLDECGCLVPGCDETCIIAVSELESSPRFKVGPNPASSSLNVFLSPNVANEIGNAEINMYDLQGKLIQSFKPHRADTTYILDVADFASGEYVLTLMGEKGMLQSERIRIEHK